MGKSLSRKCAAGGGGLPHPNPSPERLFTTTATRLAGLAGALLGWRPGEFWAATPCELAAIFDALTPPADAPPTHGDLARLQEQFPDG